MGFLEEDHRGLECHLGTFISRVNALNMTLLRRCITVDHLAEGMSRVSGTAALFPVFTLCSLQGSGGLCYTSFTLKYLHKLSGILHKRFVCFLLLIHLLWQYEFVANYYLFWL